VVKRTVLGLSHVPRSRIALHGDSFESLAGSPQGLGFGPQIKKPLALPPRLYLFGARKRTRSRTATPNRPTWRFLRVSCGKSAGTSLRAPNKKATLRRLYLFGARKRTRTSTVLPPLGPEPSASTNSAIRAFYSWRYRHYSPCAEKPQVKSVTA
jgi:hypothetical protein